MFLFKSLNLQLLIFFYFLKGITTLDDTVTIQSKTLPFDINLKSIPAFNKLEHGFNFSSAGLKIDLRRNSLGLLFGSFYGPTAIFAMLSMLSYCIKTDVVCKSMGRSICKY